MSLRDRILQILDQPASHPTLEDRIYGLLDKEDPSQVAELQRVANASVNMVGLPSVSGPPPAQAGMTPREYDSVWRPAPPPDESFLGNLGTGIKQGFARLAPAGLGGLVGRDDEYTKWREDQFYQRPAEGAGGVVGETAGGLVGGLINPAEAPANVLGALTGTAAVAKAAPIIEKVGIKAGPKIAGMLRGIIEGGTDAGSVSAIQAAGAIPDDQWARDPMGSMLRVVQGAAVGGGLGAGLGGAAGAMSGPKGFARKQHGNKEGGAEIAAARTRPHPDSDNIGKSLPENDLRISDQPEPVADDIGNETPTRRQLDADATPKTAQTQADARSLAEGLTIGGAKVEPLRTPKIRPDQTPEPVPAEAAARPAEQQVPQDGRTPQGQGQYPEAQKAGVAGEAHTGDGTAPTPSKDYTARRVVDSPEPGESPGPVTSARNAMTAQDRAAMGLDGYDGPDRRSWQSALDTAVAQGVPDRAMRIASEVNATPRALSDIETAGVVHRAATLKNEHASILSRINQSADPAAVKTDAAELARVEAEFESLTSALNKAGTEQGRALASRKLTLDQDHSLVAVKIRAKAAKGSALTPEESARFDTLTKQLEDTNTKLASVEKQLADQQAEMAIRRHAPARRRLTPQQLDAEYGALLSKARDLLAKGCD